VKAPEIIIGLDPGEPTGYAKLVNGKLTEMRTFVWKRDLLELLELLKDHCIGYHTKVRFIIETPPRGSSRARARDLGRCEEKANTLKIWIELNGGHAVLSKPLRDMTKLGGAPFENIFPEWEGRSSNHARDAAILAKFGKLYDTEEMIRH